MSEQDIRVFFSAITDPRVERTKRHKLVDIIVIAVMAVICGSDTWQDVYEFAVMRQEWLTGLLGLRHGVPSESTFKRVFRLLDATAFAAAFARWTQRLVGEDLDGKLVAIDGKTLRGSYREKGKRHPLHLVTAWVADNHVVFGQVATEAKSNEITAIPKLLEMLVLKGATVTIDAMGCQRNIADQIVDAGGDYILALKGNQSSLHTEVKDAFGTAWINDEVNDPDAVYEYSEKAHGRHVEQRIVALDVTQRLSEKQDWSGLRSIVEVHTVRRIGSNTSEEYRYYISSHPPIASLLAKSIRKHWSIENNQHWQLDVSFHEDHSRIRAGHGAENFASLRRFALSLLKRETSKKVAIKTKRKAAGWSQTYLFQVMLGAIPEPTSDDSGANVG